MKKVVFRSAVALGALTLLAGPVLAATPATLQGHGDITFERKTGGEDEDDNDILDPTDPENEKPIIPDDEDNENGSTGGPLSIDHITNYHFGKVKISGNDKTYFAAPAKIKDTANGPSRPAPNFVQVTDDRGSNAGWELTVKQAKAFTAGTTVLANTTLHINNVNVSKNKANKAEAPVVKTANIALTAGGSEVSVVNAAKETGMGSWGVLAGTNETAGKSVGLEIPGVSKKVEDVQYVGELTWTLKDEPSK